MNEYFEELYYKHHQIVYNVAYGVLKDRQDAEDVVIEVFSKLYMCLKSNVEIQNIPPWLCITAKTTAIDMLRKVSTISVNTQQEVVTEDFVDALIRKSLVDDVLRDLYRKNPKWFEYMAMHYLLEMSYEEIAKAEDVNADAVRQAIVRAKRYLNRKHNTLGTDSTYIILLVVLRLFLYDTF